MEGEAGVADLALSLEAVEELTDAQGLDLGPALGVERVHEVKIDVIGLQALQLLVKEALQILFLFHQPGRQLRCDGDLFAVAVLQRLAHDPLALLAQVDVRRIQVRHAAVDRGADDADGVLLVDDLFAVLFHHGEAHAAQAKGRTRNAQLAKGTHFHTHLSSSSVFFATIFIIIPFGRGRNPLFGPPRAAPCRGCKFVVYSYRKGGRMDP